MPHRHVLTNADLERIVDTSDEWIRSRTGIRERRVAAAHETTASMGAVAALRAIRTAGIEPDDIDLILLATLTPDYWMPATAVLVKEAIGNTRADRLRRDGRVQRVRVRLRHRPGLHPGRAGEARPRRRVGAPDPVPRLHGPEHLHPLRRRGGRGRPVGERRARRRARGRDDHGAAGRVHDLAAGRRVEGAAVGRHDRRGEHFVRMEGNQTYRFATKTMATTALESIRRSGLDPSDIDLFIPHQANIRIVEAVAKGLDLPMDKMFVNLDKYGNTSAASVPIALAEAVNEGRVKVGDNITIVAFGAGFTSGAVTINWTADPARGRAGDAAVRPEDVSIRAPIDWDSVDPIPEALAELMRRPGIARRAPRRRRARASRSAPIEEVHA